MGGGDGADAGDEVEGSSDAAGDPLRAGFGLAGVEVPSASAGKLLSPNAALGVPLAAAVLPWPPARCGGACGDRRPAAPLARVAAAAALRYDVGADRLLCMPLAGSPEDEMGTNAEAWPFSSCPDTCPDGCPAGAEPVDPVEPFRLAAANPARPCCWRPGEPLRPAAAAAPRLWTPLGCATAGRSQPALAARSGGAPLPLLAQLPCTRRSPVEAREMGGSCPAPDLQLHIKWHCQIGLQMMLMSF